MLLENGAQINRPMGPEYPSALYIACYDYNLGSENKRLMVDLLLEHNGDVNVQGGYFGNALHAASSTGCEDLVSLLLKHKANANAQGGYYGNALQAASAAGHSDVVRLLLKHKANVKAQVGPHRNALQAACFAGYMDVIMLLVEHKADVNTQGGEYGNALQAVCVTSHEKLVKLLIEKGVNVNAQGGRFGNALRAACGRGCEKVVRVLVENHVNVNGTDKHGCTALVVLASLESGSVSITRMLLENGADINACPHLGSLLERALRCRNGPLVELLIKRGTYLSRPLRESEVEVVRKGSPRFAVKEVENLQSIQRQHVADWARSKMEKRRGREIRY